MKNGWQHRIPEFKLGGDGPRRNKGSKASPIRNVGSRVRIVREDGSATHQPPPDFMAAEVDPILEKISAKGIHSLTDREREILEKAQKQFSKR